MHMGLYTRLTSNETFWYEWPVAQQNIVVCETDRYSFICFPIVYIILKMKWSLEGGNVIFMWTTVSRLIEVIRHLIF